MKRATIKERLFWCYANLAMAHSAVEKSPGCKSYRPVNFMTRARLYKGLMDGNMKLGSILDDEREKMKSSAECVFCGSQDYLSVDHLISRNKGGLDEGDNLVLACRSCNSSKGKKDLIHWYTLRGEFPPLLIIRRYLKLAYRFCLDRDLLNRKIEDLESDTIPFSMNLLPEKFPAPCRLALRYVKPEPRSGRE